MQTRQVAALLTYIALGDNRHVDELSLRFWQDMVGDLDYDDALAAIREHRRTSTDYLQPAHVLAGAAAAAAARRRSHLDAERKVAAIESGPATFQRTPEQQAYVEANIARLRAAVAGVAAKWSLPPAEHAPPPVPMLREPEAVFTAELASDLAGEGEVTS